MYRHHHGPVVGVDVEQRGRPHQVLRQVAQQRHRPADTISYIRTCFTLGWGGGGAGGEELTDLSSTSWKRQLGVWLVVKILLSGGIRGAEGTQMENKSGGQADKSKQTRDKAARAVYIPRPGPVELFLILKWECDYWV